MADSDCTSGKMALMPRYPKKKKKQQQRRIALSPDASVLLNKLCDELVEEILLRLPTKSAVKFKVVCKKWYSLISSPSFISHFIHLRRGRDLVPQSSLVFQFGCNVSEFQIISDGSLLRNIYGEDSFQLTYLPCPPNHIKLVGCSADLILCFNLNLTTGQIIYYVSNLLTRQWISLPPPPTDQDFMRSFSVGFLCFPVDGSQPPKFMMVRLSSRNSDVPLSQFKVQLFSSDDFRWRTLLVSSSLPLEPHIVGYPLVACTGMLLWLNDYSDCIVVYDPLNNPSTFSHIIHLPVHPAFLLHDHGCFGECQGHLRAAVIPLVADDEDPILDVWELEDYDSGLWNLVYRVHLQNLISNKSERRRLTVISFHPENRDVIYLRITDRAVLLNMKNRIIEGVYQLNKEASFSFLNAFHLADQWWPTAVSSLH